MDKLYLYLCEQNVADDKTKRVVGSIVKQIQDYLWLKTLISVGTGGAVWFVAWVCGLDFPIVWGFLAFVLNYIPSIGPLIASFPPILLAYFQFSDHLGWATFVSLLIRRFVAALTIVK